MKLSTPLPLLIVALVLSSATSAPVGMSPPSAVVADSADQSSSIAAAVFAGGVDEDAATATIVAASSDGRDLQQSSVNCDITAAYHPDYTLGWNLGHSVLTPPRATLQATLRNWSAVRRHMLDRNQRLASAIWITHRR